jgi:hypothetical protein
MADLGLGTSDRDGYEAYVAGRVLELGVKAGRGALAEEWKGIRRGWYLGGEGFRGRLLKKVKETLGKTRDSSHSGDAKQDHGEQQAERLLQRALSALKIRSSHLAEARKGMREKQVLAWWLCQHTTVRRRWVSERLAMGDESRVTQAIRSIKGTRLPAMEGLKKRLAILLNQTGEFTNDEK